MKRVRPLVADTGGAAAAEMALVAPLLLILMFGAFETGRYFWDEHVVTKAVRDGARFAGRQTFASMPCDGSAASGETTIRNVVRYGTPTVTDNDKPLLSYWTDADTIDVAIDCYPNAGADGARVYDGIYTDRTEVPRVTVSASVPYTPLVYTFGIFTGDVTLNASSQAVVFGI